MTVLTEIDDSDLLTLVRDGDTHAMAELWSRHYPATLAAARRISRQPKDAEEFASDAFSGMLQALRNDAGPATSVRAYLLTAVRNQATNKARRASASDVLTDEITDYETTDNDALDPVAHHAELGLVREAFASLPQRWQTVLWRTAVDHDRNTVIAADLGMSPNAIAALARRARAGFRTAYIQAHSSSHGIAPECAPYVARLVELLPASGSVASKDVRAHVDDCAKCRLRVADLEAVDRDLGGMLLPAVLALGPGITWAVAAPVTKGAGALLLKLGFLAGHTRKLAIGGAATAVAVAGMASAYALSHESPGQHAATTAASHGAQPAQAANGAGGNGAAGGGAGGGGGAAHAGAGHAAPAAPGHQAVHPAAPPAGAGGTGASPSRGTSTSAAATGTPTNNPTSAPSSSASPTTPTSSSTSTSTSTSPVTSTTMPPVTSTTPPISPTSIPPITSTTTPPVSTPPWWPTSPTSSPPTSEPPICVPILGCLDWPSN